MFNFALADGTRTEQKLYRRNEKDDRIEQKTKEQESRGRGETTWLQTPPPHATHTERQMGRRRELGRLKDNAVRI